MSIQKSKGLPQVPCHICQPPAPSSAFSWADLLCGLRWLWWELGHRNHTVLLISGASDWALTLTHHLLCFSGKMLQMCGAWKMLWLNPQRKHFKYNVNAVSFSSEFYNPALPAAPLPWHATKCVYRLSFRPAAGLQYKGKAVGVGEEICVFILLEALHCSWPRCRQHCSRAQLNWWPPKREKGFVWAMRSPQRLGLLLALRTPSRLISLRSEVTQHPEVQRTVQ